MNLKSLNFRRVLALFTVIAMTSAAVLMAKNTLDANTSFFGHAYTTKADGTTVNANIYDTKDDVYLNGGPQNMNSNGLPNGTYYFQVTDPSGATLLSTDDAVCRQVTVSGGVVSGASPAAGGCAHANGSQNSNNGGSIPVQLQPFADTTNTGGEYKVWLIRQDTGATASGVIITFNSKDAKTDNFHVKPPVPPSLSVLTEVDVTGAFGETLPQVNPAFPPSVPVVTWNGSTYVVHHDVINLVTPTFGWSVQVQDRAFVTVNGAIPQGTAVFSLFSNDKCTGTPDVISENSTWTATGNPGEYVSGLSDPFTFSNGGNWAYSATYVGTDYGTVADPGCEAWPIPTVTTDIKKGGVSVTGGAVTVNDTIYDTASVNTNDTGIPSGSTVEFQLFATNNCSGTPTSSTFNLTSTSASETDAVSSNDTVLTRYVSYIAIFHIPNVESVADSTCEKVGVIGLPLVVSKTANPALTRQYYWNIAKSVDSGLKESAGSSTFNYTVTVNGTGTLDSLWNVTGGISVNNPNPTGWDVTLSGVPTDSIDNGGSCSVTSGPLGVTAGATISFPYSCTFTFANPSTPTTVQGTNSATAAYSDPQIPAAAAGTATYDFSSAAVTAINKTINVTDTYKGALGTVTYPNTGTFTYSRIVTPAAGACLTVPNTATITETGQNASASAEACNTTTAALTIGFWQNKNGQAIITGGGSTAGVCNSGAFLRTYAPFQDLGATATCAQVASYATGIIKTASAAGAAMNAMLKAQMLATAFDVYFSSAAGGNKIGPGSLGPVAIDLTHPTNVSSAFGGATSLTVSQILAYAASQSNAGGSAWYGQVKATQALAEVTFDNINNSIALIAP